MEWRRSTEEDFAALERGWYAGSEEFRKELLAQMKAGSENYGQEVREKGEQKALQRIEVELKKLRWTAADLIERAKGGVEKIPVAKISKRETTMTLDWIAQALHVEPKPICRTCSTGMANNRNGLHLNG